MRRFSPLNYFYLTLSDLQTLDVCLTFLIISVKFPQVVAPVEPKSIGRHNLSPFTAASLLERNSNTPPHYKFHVPRAVDSITQEVPRSMYASRVNASATLPGKEASLAGPRGAENQIHRDDGLAAILAAKIRTKAELKQVRCFYLTLIALRNCIDYTDLMIYAFYLGWNRPIFNKSIFRTLSGCVVDAER